MADKSAIFCHLFEKLNLSFLQKKEAFLLSER